MNINTLNTHRTGVGLLRLALSVMLLVALTSFKTADGKASSHYRLHWEFSSHRIASKSTISMAIPNNIGDGKDKLITGCFKSGQIFLYEKSAKKMELIRKIGTAKYGISDMALISMDGGDNRLVVANEKIGSISIFDIKGKHRDMKLFHGPRNISALEVADIDSDGLGDIIPASYDGTTELWFKNVDNKRFTAKKFSSKFKQVSALKAMDFDFDGDQDLLIASDHLRQVILYTNDGKGNFESTIVLGDITNVLDMEAIDIDQDGDQEVVIAAHNKKHVLLMKNEGDTFTQRKISTKLRAPNALQKFDLGNDGREDLIISSFDDNAVKVIENAPAGLVEHTLGSEIPAPTDIKVIQNETNRARFYVSSLVENKLYSVGIDITGLSEL